MKCYNFGYLSTDDQLKGNDNPRETGEIYSLFTRSCTARGSGTGLCRRAHKSILFTDGSLK